jgi:chromate reductase, NAD(P)H dehydrogenase (quinone)
VKILGIAGSLRHGSYNRALLREAEQAAPPGVELDQFDLRDLPLFDADVEAAGEPAVVRAFKDAIRSADALLIATPEYNRGTSGVLKNAIDWASRPPFGSPLSGKPVAVMGAGGRRGTAGAQAQVRDALAFPRANVLTQSVLVPMAWERFDEDGRLTDEATKAELSALVDALVSVAQGRELAEVA